MVQSLSFRAMNTDFLVEGLSAHEASEVRRQISAAEAALSRFLPDSEISRINHAGGEWLKVSPLVYDVLDEAVSAFRSTEGLFNPFMGRALRELGYDRSFEQLKPVAWPISAAAFAADVLPLEMDAQLQRVRLSPEYAVDLGGIAKGWTAQRSADALLATDVRAGLIDAGGDVVLWGREPEQGLWGIGVGNPQGEEEDVAELWFEGLTALATSSVVKRSWQVQGRGTAHHILDPRTGNSAESDLLQATVIGRDLVSAEQFAKCLLVLGSAAGLSWLGARRPELAYIVVRRDGVVLSSGNLDLYAKKWDVKNHVELSDKYR